jgi:DNA-binding IclR family transcriptional regulator
VTGVVVNRLQTVDRALQLLNCFTTVRPVWGISDLGRELGIAKSMVARLVETLEAHGFLERNPETRRFVLGLRLVGLGLVAQSSGGDLHRMALPLLERLSLATGETSMLCVPRGIHSVCVEQVASPHQGLRLAIERGTISPLYAGASNKAVLAFLPEEQIELVIAAGLPVITKETVVDHARLREQLAQIRQAGWHASTGEMSPDVSAVAAPIFDPSGRAVGSISVGGPASRYTPAFIAELAPKVIAAAQVLTNRMAGR